MEKTLTEAEIKVLELLWKFGQMPAKELGIALKERHGWSKSTTYTVLNRMIEKDLIKRLDHQFTCLPKVSKVQAQTMETARLIEKLFDGSMDDMIDMLHRQQRKTGVQRFNDAV